MADDRIPTIFTIDPKTNEIHRKRGKGNEQIEDKVIAKYDPESQVVTVPNLNYLRNYKAGIMTFLAENEMLIRSWQRADLEPDKPLGKNIPPRPKKTKHEGDKTPAVVEWYQKYKPNEFATRYGVLGRYTGPATLKIPVWEPRPVDGLKEYRGEQLVARDLVDVIVATRKTHLTYTPDECDECNEEEPETGELAAIGSRRSTEEEEG